MAIIKPSLPKGTRDFLPEQMFRRQYVMRTVKDIFERYGYAPLETPSIEKLEVLSGKYGDEGETLIFKVLKRGTGLENLLRDKQDFVVREYSDLVDEALRYDLTVPLSRVVAMYQNDLILPFKRYQIQPVWRADRPQRGRYREFYQCDVDTVGTESMLADAETIAVVYDVLSTLGFKQFKIKINNRKILNGILQYAGLPTEKGNSVFITIDKLDKIGIDGVKSELKNRDVKDEQVNKIFRVLDIKGEPEQILSELHGSFNEIDTLNEGTEELKQIVSYLDDLGISKDHFDIDLYLARGLGYYTGPVYECVVEEPKIGSLCGGGRYDKLIGMFLGRDIPATGVAFGIERIIDVMTQLDMLPETTTKTAVLVTLFDAATLQSSLKFTQQLRNSGIKAENYFELAKIKKQFAYANRKKIPFVVIIGPDEMAANQVNIKNMKTGEQQLLAINDGIKFLQRVESE